MRLALGLVLILVGIAVFGFGCYFAAMGLFARSPDNALINYVLLAAPPIVLGLATASVGRRTVKDARQSPGGKSPR